MKKSKIYGNIEVYSSNDELMFICNERKLKFYIKNNLVEKINDFKYKLLFTPKALGYYNRNKALLLPRENKCVICGESNINLLTRHHIVPTKFRKFFPDNIKGNDYRFVVFLDKRCHADYNIEENILTDTIAKELNIQTLEEYVKTVINDKHYIYGIAYTILFRNEIPLTRIEELKLEFKKVTNEDASFENLQKAIKLNFLPKYKDNCISNDWGKLVINKIENIYQFQQRWLEHFVETMQPKFLPKDLSILL